MISAPSTSFGRILLTIVIISGVIIFVEVIALVWLYFSVARYKSYWEARAQVPGTMTYLALGDSAAQGICATSPARGFVGLLADRLHAKNPEVSLRVVNLSRTGATMQDYLAEQAPKIKDIQADLVTIEIGANDIKTFAPDTFRADFKRVLATLPDGAYVSNMPLFNSRPGSTQHAKDASVIIAEELKAYPKLNFVDLQQETTNHQSILGFAPDLFHPNNLSYPNWANAFWNEIKR